METMMLTKEAQWQDEAAGWLEPLLVDLVSLALTGKQAHWHVTGPNFLPVHEQLDEIVADLHSVLLSGVMSTAQGAKKG